jgi:glycosyltransferase involved in cell wall biosynthesis
VIRLAQITPHLSSGGVEQRIARVIAGLDRDRFEITWIGLGERNDALIEKAGAEVHVASTPRSEKSGFDYALIWRIAETLRRRSVEVAHVHNWSTSVYGIAAAQLAGVKHVIYGVGGREQPEGATARQRAVMRVLAPYVDGFSTVCDFLAREMAVEWGVPPSRVSTIRTGLDVDRYRRTASRAEARRRLDVPADAIVFGALTVLRPVKRIEDLVAAAGRVAETDPRIHVALVGNIFADSADTIRGWANEAGLGDRIRIPGRIEDPENVLAGFDVYVNCSVFEGASNAIMEAMAAGLPIVATRVGGTPELVEERENAILVGPRDVAALADAFATLARDADLRARMGEHARRWVGERHNLDRMVRAYADLYERIAREPPTSLARRGARSVLGAIGAARALRSGASSP